MCIRDSHITSRHFETAYRYAKDISEKIVKANVDRVLACRRFLEDLEREDLDFRQEDFDFAIDYIQTCVRHVKGEDTEGQPFKGKLMVLVDWQIFVIVNLFGFFIKGTNIRRYNDCLLYTSRCV